MNYSLKKPVSLPWPAMSFLPTALLFLFPRPPVAALAGGLFWGGWFSSLPCSVHSLLASFLFKVPVALLSCSGWVDFPPAWFQAFPLCSPRADWPGPSHLRFVASRSKSTKKKKNRKRGQKKKKHWILRKGKTMNRNLKKEGRAEDRRVEKIMMKLLTLVCTLTGCVFILQQWNWTFVM